MRPKLLDGYFGCIAALAHAGNNLIVDHVMETPNQLHRLVDLLAPFDVFYVGVHCPLPELERRERQRGDRRPGDARRDYETVHSFGLYDVEVDATLSPDENAETLVGAWKTWRPPGMFRACKAGASGEEA
jgi:chloramphenicol 3-O phosphotransferase